MFNVVLMFFMRDSRQYNKNCSLKTISVEVKLYYLNPFLLEFSNSFCSGFRYESNGIFELGVGFIFSSDKFRLFN